MAEERSHDELVRRVADLEEELAECRKAERTERLKSEARLNAILGSVSDHMSMVDRELNVLWVNKAAINIFGDDIVGRPCYEVYRGRSEPCEPYPCITLQAFADGASHSHESVLLTREGKRIHLLATANVTSFNACGQPETVIKVCRDITERRQTGQELKTSLEKLRKALAGTIQAMALTVETRDAYTAGHQRRSTALARAIALEMGLAEDLVDGIRMAGVIHDLGKISIPAEILSKPGKITENEFNLIKDHPRTGYDILKNIEFQWPIAEIVLQHHERMDGSGYPRGLKGEEILLEARILAVADVIEAMASHRPYRPALGLDEAMAEITSKRGTRYDAEAVDASVELFSRKGFHFDSGWQAGD